jgi:type IV pilus assembly protein PilE
MTLTDRPARAHGFTLIELMIAMVIFALLLGISIPTYNVQVRKARRTDAKTAVLDLAGREERLYSVTNAYSQTPSDLGYGAVGVAWPAVVIGNSYYTVNVVAAATTFTVTATASSTDQLKDTACRTYTVNQLGVQGATNSVGATSAAITATCWR